MQPDVIIQKINQKDFAPIILRSSFFKNEQNLPDGYELESRYVYDYELEFFVDSSASGSIIVNNKKYDLKKGDIMFRYPGQSAQGIMSYSCYLICFDLLGNTGKDPKSYEISKKQSFQNLYQNTVLNTIPTVFHPDSPGHYQSLFARIFKEYVENNPASPLLLRARLLEIIYKIFSEISQPSDNNNITSSSHQIELENTIEYIKNNLDKKITLEQLSRVAKLSPNHFHKIFTKTIGTTPNKYITCLKLKKAKKLLVTSTLNISEIALQCGYQNIPYFSIIFKKYFNISPLEFRKRHNYI